MNFVIEVQRRREDEGVIGGRWCGTKKPQSQETRVKFELEDIKDEVSYWNLAIVYYVLGANPPLPVIKGFARRIWKTKSVDRISMLAHGFFIVQFGNIQARRYPSNTNLDKA
ncbi:unnamed protein product [Vicia faba]|uniref:Uncharacterized protein n=1 Tax=Vicia faba TaxID=3906 RepID=A0AAV1AKZ6_VICFA|nr:unnamed protein product [Vicia faba]